MDECGSILLFYMLSTLDLRPSSLITRRDRTISRRDSKNKLQVIVYCEGALEGRTIPYMFYLQTVEVNLHALQCGKVVAGKKGFLR
jgi:hypothetical protein